ncbi:DUF6973 domain-containing protein [Nocardia altamirensis]|uniref:DUF6973 domain-containing protein n=1 Tax=Nocardia altamirensis TaxID=472158 RepID=UPI00084018F5|nr:hypothetical protein [Nocardia altamirensis]
MATWDEIKRWQPDVIEQLCDHLDAQKKLVIELEDELDGAKAAGWTGSAADVADSDLRGHRQALEEFAARLAAAVRIVYDTKNSVRELVRAVEATDDLAAKNGYRIENGAVVETDNVSGWFAAVETLQMNVKAALTNAAAIDTELNSVLRRIMSGDIDDAGATTLASAAHAGEFADELRHDDLLTKYQVKTDGTTIWPTGPTAFLAKLGGIAPERLTKTEAAMLNDLQARKGLLGLKEFADIRQDALHLAKGKFDGKGGTDGHADAFRHAYWNAVMTQRYGEQWTREFTTAHERNPTGHRIPVGMDLHNNEVGREIARANPGAGPERLANLVEQAVKDGRMLVIDKNDTLIRSNEVNAGATRDTQRYPWPTGGPARDGDHDPGTPTAKPNPY